MTRSKFTTDRLPSYHSSRSSHSVPLERVSEEEEPVAPHSTAEMATLSKPPSRLNRLSQYLPAILTSDAKLPKDHQPVLRKPMPADSIIQLPPTRAPPAAPSQPTTTNTTMPPPPSPTPHKLQKQSTPPVQVASPRDASPSPHSLDGRRPRANSLLPPQPDMAQTRSFSTPIASRPVSTNMSDGESDGKLKKRRSWLPGSSSKSRSRNPSQDLDAAPSRAWVLAAGSQIDYNLNFLLGGDKIPELWDDSKEANMFVYLHPRSTGRGPQIKCHSLVVQCSQILLDIIYDDSLNSATGSGRSRGRSFDGRGSLSIEDATRNLAIRGPGTPPYTPKVTPDNHSGSDDSGEGIPSFADVPRDLHLYYPVDLHSSGPQFPDQDVQKLVEARNLFAFFNGQPLVSTPACPSIFHIFMNIAAALKKFEFYGIDGTTFGEAADASFGFYLAEMRLADVRNSREKTVEGLILGERMRCSTLYNESFAHAVGKLDSISLDLPIFKELSATTQLQLEQSRRDLVKQQQAAGFRLTDFDFPSMFSGIASSTSSAESKVIRFRNWKANYISLRKQVLYFYKDRYGQWPPKASSKKNTFNEGGLSRLVLKLLYADLCALYDLLVDRSAFTTRGMQASEDKESGLDVSPSAAALRKLLAEFDRSSPPVQPPIPFDTPLVPTIQTVEPTYPSLAPKDQHKLQTRKLKEYEMLLLLSKSHNVGVEPGNQFLEMYQAFEEKEGRGKNALELSEQRYGHWIFLYAVIQSLPLLVTDAPTLQFTENVEHFLCQMPANPRPWLEDGNRANRSWYNVAGGTGVVSLPSHMVEFSVEATYSRSHCWKVAEQLVGGDAAETLHSEALEDGLMSPLQPPPGFGDGELRPRSRGRQRSSSTGLNPHDLDRNTSRQSQRRSIALGLERLPAFPGNEGFDPDGSRSRPMSRGSISGMSPAMSRGTSPMAPAGRRTASRSGDLMMGMGGQGQSQGGSVSGGGGSTFDDILGNINKGQEKVEKKKTKKGFF